MRESEEQFAKAFRAGPLMMVIADLNDGRLLEVNEAFARFTGYARKALLGCTPLELGLLRGDPRDRQTMLESLRRDGSVRDLEIAGRDRASCLLTTLVSAERLRLGGRDYLLGMAMDISERKALKEQTRLAQKRESLAVIAVGVAHDFNNLLQTILGNADQALLDLPFGAVTRAVLSAWVALSKL